ncbi:hypothetical protein ACUTAH_24730 [Metapseudomonas furukawaii]|uniref:hypothetical protein n=1 Tax=Metapseudomonas furukawaii TaxID=1149133 RepID=UPI0040463F65
MGLSIGRMPPARPLQDDDLFEIVQGGSNHKFTGKQLRQAIVAMERIKTVAGVGPDESGDIPLNLGELAGGVRSVAGKKPDAKGDVPLAAADLGLAGLVKKVANKVPDAAGNVPLTTADLGLTGLVKKVAGKVPDAAGNVPLTAADLGLAGLVRKVANKVPDAAGNVPLTAADLGLTGLVKKVAGKVPDVAGNVPLTAADLGLAATEATAWTNATIISSVVLKSGGQGGATDPSNTLHAPPARFRRVGRQLQVDGCIYCVAPIRSPTLAFKLPAGFIPKWGCHVSVAYTLPLTSQVGTAVIQVETSGNVSLPDYVPHKANLYINFSIELD